MSNTVFGSVLANGNIRTGSGFKVVHESAGVYTILFNTEFASRPAVVVTQHYPEADDFSSDGGSTLDNAVIIAVSKDRFKYTTGEGSGHKTDRAVEFIAVGQ